MPSQDTLSRMKFDIYEQKGGLKKRVIKSAYKNVKY